MGVKGLWRLLLPIGRRISIETAAGQIWAIDASIWLTQFLKAMRDPETGRVQASAHLIGFFRRLCRLRFHGIRPVLVFDGATPEIKRREIALRRKRREQFAQLSQATVQRMARRLLQEQLLLQQKKFKGSTNPKNGNDSNSNSHYPASATAAVAVDASAAALPLFNPGMQLDPEDRLDEQPREMLQHTTANSITNLQEEQSILQDARQFLNEKQNGFELEQEDVNDWDQPVVDVDVDGSDHDDPSSRDNQNGNNNGSNIDNDHAVEYEDFGVTLPDASQNLTRTRQTRHRFAAARHRGRPFGLSTDLVDNPIQIQAILTQLPPNERKEWIEQAKRDQRLRSRREFMPAAANPMHFSAVQVTNFLRSSRLNQRITAAAQQATTTAAAAQQQTGQLQHQRLSARTTTGNKPTRQNCRRPQPQWQGDVMASDWARRVELLRDEEASQS